MRTQTPKPKFIFVNPNTSKEFTDMIRKILTEKLIAAQGASRH